MHDYSKNLRMVFNEILGSLEARNGGLDFGYDPNPDPNSRDLFSLS